MAGGGYGGTDEAADSNDSGDDETSSEPAASSARLPVQEFFDDPKLLAYIQQALDANRELKILDQEVQIAANKVLARRGAYWPFVTGGIGAGLEKPSLFTPQGAVEDQLPVLPEEGKAFPDPLPDFLGRLNLFWEVDIWRQLRNARDAAIQRYLAAIQRRNFFVTRLVAEVADSYYELLALDQQLATLDSIIELQQRSLELARAQKEAGRSTELPVQRFLAELRKSQSEKLVVQQEIVQTENRINGLLLRFPEKVERASERFLDIQLHALEAGLPSELLLNRPDIIQAERELIAAGLDIQVARAEFFPKLEITASVGYRAFNPRYLINPEALIYDAAGDLVAPLINRKAIRAEFMNANAEQLRALYNYQQTIVNAYIEVVNLLAKVQNYTQALALKRQQLEALELSVDVANQLYQNARVEYLEVLLAQRDLLTARMEVIETKQQQLSAIVNAYRALGGGWQGLGQVDQTMPAAGGAMYDVPPQPPEKKGVSNGDDGRPVVPAAPPAEAAAAAKDAESDMPTGDPTAPAGAASENGPERAVRRSAEPDRPPSRDGT
ncbi:MAG: efflux transporter outer membrane subunit [Planctomycetota bacterium]|nr:MAG: efflux transporter outer membrane subunit [Planctomycetota bacterium]